MKRCNWDGAEIRDTDAHDQLPSGGVVDPFQYLPAEIVFTSKMTVIADRYESGDIDFTSYSAFQAASFLRPRSAAQHDERRTQFASLRQQVEAMGFQLPESLIRLIETDNYVDRLHHNTIWLCLPDELWRLPADPEKLMFLVFREGQGCCYWHLLLAQDRSHCVVCCEEAFGMPSGWHKVPDFNTFEVRLCADSFDEWLCYFFRDSAEGDRHYIQWLDDTSPGLLANEPTWANKTSHPSTLVFGFSPPTPSFAPRGCSKLNPVGTHAR